MSVLALLVTALVAQSPGPATSARPVILFLGRVPFDIMGSNNVPDFVLYDDGTAIYQIEDSIEATNELEATYPRFATSHLDAATFGILMGLATSANFRALAPRYDLDPDGSEWDIDVIQVWDSSTSTRVWVRGPRKEWPAAFTALYAQVHHFHQPTERVWLPDSIEIELTRIVKPCVISDPVPWPTTLPPPGASLDSAVVRYRVSVSELQEVQQLFHRVDIGGRCTPLVLGPGLWEFSFRYPFPGEAAWGGL